MNQQARYQPGEQPCHCRDVCHATTTGSTILQVGNSSYAMHGRTAARTHQCLSPSLLDVMQARKLSVTTLSRPCLSATAGCHSQRVPCAVHWGNRPASIAWGRVQPTQPSPLMQQKCLDDCRAAKYLFQHVAATTAAVLSSSEVFAAATERARQLKLT